MKEKIESLYSTARSTGLELNVDKTKTMRANTSPAEAIHLGEQQIEDVCKFTYLGSIVKIGGADKDTKARINKARFTFTTLKPIWSSANIHLASKLKLFTTNVRSVLLYGLETWRFTLGLEQKVTGLRQYQLTTDPPHPVF